MADERTTARPPVSPSPAVRPTVPAGASTAAKTKADPKKEAHPRDVTREVFETVVFVVVLVLMLKTFVAEAFVIPTGSMAETLYGYHKEVTCKQCGFQFPVNCSSEVDPQDGNAPIPVEGCTCPNCQYHMSWGQGGPEYNSGDRVLVAKFLFDSDHLWRPKRHQVFVFKYPGDSTRQPLETGPQKGSTAMNYIKRCEGLPTETIAIFNGNLYVTTSLKYPDHPMPESQLNLWEYKYMYVCDESALNLFQNSIARLIKGEPQPGDFEIVRQGPEEILSMRRIVNNNDFQPKDLADQGIQRWQFAKGNWSGDDASKPKTFTFAPKDASQTTEWITYHHLVYHRDERARELGVNRGMPGNPAGFESDNRKLITNMLGYNTGDQDRNIDVTGHHWVGDLMLDCEVKVTNPQGEFVLELSKGMDRFQARFDVATGKCKLIRRTGRVEETMDEKVLAEKDTKLKGAGTYHVRFANFDEQLTVWVGSQLPFGNGVAYPPSKDIGPVGENDIKAPARVGARSAGLSVTHLQLWRNTYYTLNQSPNIPVQPITVGSNPEQKIQTFYVQPGHYLALGDNSSASSDSRYWGQVPERLLLGRALWVYYPFGRFGGIE
ncbi:MAG TPA: S26 family signal peptidase [Gemmataceae bacterium]|nr:S26 family signal peptidase [Gemmataceae bacterium]